MNQQTQWLFETPLTLEKPEWEAQTINSDVSGEKDWEASRFINRRQPIRETISGFPRYSNLVRSLPAKEQQKIDQMARLIVNSYRPGQQPIRTVQLIGHADKDTPRRPDFEKKISGDRASAIQKALINAINQQRSGLAAQITWQITKTGATRLIVLNPVTEQQRARNRRVEILLETRSKGGTVDPNSPPYIHQIQGCLNRILGTRLVKDGVLGQQTRTAIRSFQQQRGLPVNGMITPQTIAAMQRFHCLFFDEPPAPIPTPIPRDLKLVDHFHIPKSLPDGKVGALTRLNHQNMNPGFISPTDDLLVDRRAGGLQTLLDNLIKNKYTKFLESKSKAQSSAKRGDRIKVALVDLTGNKLFNPDLAGWGSTLAIEGASVPKICALYAVHQLCKDLDHLAERFPRKVDLIKEANRIWSNANFSSQPKLEALFEFPPDGSIPFHVKFSANLKATLTSIFAENCNCAATRLILQLGFNYIASVLWQSGLRHPIRGGLWLKGGYCCVDGDHHCPPSTKKVKEVRGFLQPDTEVIECSNKKGLSITWKTNPVSQPKEVFRHNITALSVATFYTLLAQGRLVDNRSSTEMKTLLERGCSLTPQGFRDKLSALGGLLSSPAKCGVDDRHLHESILVERGRFRYVVVALTSDAPDFPFDRLIEDLDRLIQANNP
jgi:peptidoglycan hydrolase-like protein with peptidoglycan-binding domain